MINDLSNFDNEIENLLRIEQDYNYRPVDLAPPKVAFKASKVPTEADHLYRDIIGSSQQDFTKQATNALKDAAQLRALETVTKAVDNLQSSGDTLAKGHRSSRSIPYPYQAQCILCSLNFMSKAELDSHDAVSAELHKALL